MQASRQPKRRFQPRRTAIVLLAMFVVAVPWWWSWFPEQANVPILGAPLWFVTAIGGSLAISLMTARYLGVAWDALDDDGANEP